jgi:hypothetical protein
MAFITSVLFCKEPATRKTAGRERLQLGLSNRMEHRQPNYEPLQSKGTATSELLNLLMCLQGTVVDEQGLVFSKLSALGYYYSPEHSDLESGLKTCS